MRRTSPATFSRREKEGAPGRAQCGIKHFRDPNASVAGWKIIELAELPVPEPLVKLRRLKREGVEIGCATALRSRGRFGVSHELGADPVLAIGVGNPQPMDE